MKYYAVIDTNVFLSALISKRDDAAMEKREDDAYLITGNQKHYPIKDFIVTPAEIIKPVYGGSNGPADKATKCRRIRNHPHL